MSYYTGQGDYYSGKGDPGIFGTIFGGIKGAVGGLLSGGPLGALKGAISGVIGPSAPAGIMLPGGGPRVPMVAPSIPQRIRIAGQALIPGGVEPGMGAACTPGYHLDKRTRSKCVRNRSMNVANPKALRRAIRREAGFVTLAKQTLRGSGWTFKRTGYPKRAKRRG